MSFTGATLVVIAAAGAAGGVPAATAPSAPSASTAPAAAASPANPATPRAPALPPAPSAPSADAGSNEPRVEHHVAEDDYIRVEELRVRGESQRIVVKHKGGAREYEIVPTSGAIDRSQGHRRTAGERVWRILSF